MQTVFTRHGLTLFRRLFLVPLAAATPAALILALFFRQPAKPEPKPS